MKTSAPTKPRTLLSSLTALASLALLGFGDADAQGSGFTYQGQLANGGSPASGNHNFTFTLKSAATGGANVGTPATNTRNAVPVTNGVFSTSLDFGPVAFSGGGRWLEIAVNGTTLSPRQPLTPAPLALGLPNLYALNGRISLYDSTRAFWNLSANVGQSGGRNVDGNSAFFYATNQSSFWRGVLLGDVAAGAFVQGGSQDAGGNWSNRDLLLQHEGGNIGIGTSNPTWKLSANLGRTAGRAADGNSAFFHSTDGSSNRSGVLLGDVAAGAFVQGGSQAITGEWINRDLLLQNEGGNVGIGTAATSEKLTIAGNMMCTTAIITSDRNKKAGFAPVDAREVLAKVAAMPISKWHYKTDAGVDHIGPVAQDFHAAFGVGTDDKHIATVDADGLAVAAIQGLNALVEEKDARIQALEERLEKLERKLGN